MKILHVIETLAVEGGGGDRACIELARHQAILGHKVTVLCHDDPDKTPLEGLDVQVHRLPRSPRTMMRKALNNACAVADVVHVHAAWRCLQVWARRACQRAATPYFYQPHGLYSAERMRHKFWHKMLWFQLFEQAALMKAAGVVVESERDRAAVRAIAPQVLFADLPCGGGLQDAPVLNAPFLERFPDLAGKNYLLYFGRLDFHKGLDLLIDAYARCREFHARHPLAIVGPDVNNTSRQLRAQVEQLGLQSVIFHEKVTDLAGKAALFDAAEAFILPSYDENFGITVLEALSRGCPVLVSSATAWDFLEAEGAGMVFAPRVEEVEMALVRFFALTPEARRALGTAGLAIAQRYDWLEIARRSITLYAGALRKNNA